MAEVVVIGAGLSGTLMAYELLPQLRKEDRLSVVSQGAVYHFVPSNPWVAIGWRKRVRLLVRDDAVGGGPQRRQGRGQARLARDRPSARLDLP